MCNIEKPWVWDFYCHHESSLQSSRSISLAWKSTCGTNCDFVPQHNLSLNSGFWGPCTFAYLYLESCWSWIGLFNFCICLFLIWQEQIRSQDMRRFSKDKSVQLPFLLQCHQQSRLSSLSSSSLGVITNREENWSFLKIHGNKFQDLWLVDRTFSLSSLSLSLSSLPSSSSRSL